MIQLYTVYKRHTLDLKLQTGWKWKDEKIYSMPKKAGVVMLISDKTDFKTKTVTKDK